MKKWYPCELHCHTLHSDGSFTVEELMKTAQQRLLDGICLTDHNTVSGWEETDKYNNVTVLKGIEYTTYHGHMLSLGIKKPEIWYTISNIDSTIENIRKDGGIVGIAHPFQLGTPICTGGHWDYKITKWENVSYMEIFSEGSPFMNTANKKARRLWHSLLSKGYKITPTMGRDWHNPKGDIFPSACTYLLIDGEITADKMKQAIEKGRTVISAGPLFTFCTDEGKTSGDEIESGECIFNFVVDFTRHNKLEPDRKIVPEKIVIASNKGEREYPVADKITITLEKNSWYSAELWGSVDGKENMLLALTSPIYTKER